MENYAVYVPSGTRGGVTHIGIDKTKVIFSDGSCLVIDLES